MRTVPFITFFALVSHSLASTTRRPESSTRTTTAPASTTTPSPAQDEISVEEMQMLLRLLMLRGDNIFGFSSAPRRPAREAPEWVVGYFNRISQIATSPEHVITVPRIENQVRVIGQEIYDAHGHEGMVAVCEYNRQYKAYIERAWDGIGRWLA